MPDTHTTVEPLPLPETSVIACSALTLNVPQFFDAPEFLGWLNNDDAKMTWYAGGVPNEYSDVVVLVDPSFSGEGSDSDMPPEMWDQIVATCKAHLRPSASEAHVLVRLTNLPE